MTYSGAATGLNIVGPDDEGEISQSGTNYTINASFTAAGTYSGTITTISDGGCPEVIQDIVITVNPAPATNAGNTGNSGNTNNTNDSSDSSQSGTSSSTNDSSSSAETFSIDVSAASFSDYSLSGRDRNGSVSGNDASITVKVGDTINFNLSVSGHPLLNALQLYLMYTRGLHVIRKIREKHKFEVICFGNLVCNMVAPVVLFL